MRCGEFRSGGDRVRGRSEVEFCHFPHQNCLRWHRYKNLMHNFSAPKPFLASIGLLFSLVLQSLGLQRDLRLTLEASHALRLLRRQW